VPRRLLLLFATAPLALAALAGCGSEEQGDAPELILERAGDEADAPGDAPPPTFPNTATPNTIRVAGRDATEDAAGVAAAVFPATSDDDRPDAVALVDEDDWQGGVAAAVLASDAIGAPILLTEGDEVPAVTAGTLARLDPPGSAAADGAEVIRIGDSVPRPDGREDAVISGADPFELAAEIDRFSAEAAGEPSENVVLASAEEAAFAMPAAAWAARSGDAVLFTEKDALPEATIAALEEHDRPDVYMLGPESVISETVEGELDDVAGKVKRIEGEDPVETAVEFARYDTGSFGWGLVTPGHNFTLASTSRPLDAAVAATLATNGTFAPLLLTDDATELPSALRGYLLDVQPGFEENPNRGVYNRVWILGDQATLSLAVQSEVDELTELIPVEVDGEPVDDAAPPDGGSSSSGDDGGDGDGGGQTFEDFADDPPPDDGSTDPLPPSDDGPVGPGGIPAPQGPGVPP
jgi:hypothetical protein